MYMQKQKGEDLEINKLAMTSTCKTAPLQSFYNQTDPPSKPALRIKVRFIYINKFRNE
jgi:hypothetical protein